MEKKIIEMTKFAVIDVGSNSVRLMNVADGKVLYKTLNTTRLGEGISRSKFLKSEAIERTVKAVSDFYFQAKSEGAEKVYAFATAAVRTAENGVEFTQKVKDLCGVDVEIISGEKEAELGLSGALGRLDGGIIDIGGASTEIVLRKQGKITFKKSVDIGVVRIKDECGYDKSLLEKFCFDAVKKYGDIEIDVPMYAIGGTATTLGAIKSCKDVYEPNKVTGTVFTSEEVRTWSDKLSKMTVNEIEKLPCMQKKRADVIYGGVYLLATVMEKLKIKEIIISDGDNLEGFAKDKGIL